MPYIHHLIVLISLLSLASPYLLDDNSYFYINTSYTRQTISVSMCFKLNSTAHIELASDVIIPQGSHRTAGTIKKDEKIEFDPPFDD